MLQPVTEVQAEVWRLRFDPDRLLTQDQIGELSGHYPGLILNVLQKLQARTPESPPNEEEQELIDLALRVPGAKDLEHAYQLRNLQVQRYRMALRHKKFHDEQSKR